MYGGPWLRMGKVSSECTEFNRGVGDKIGSNRFWGDVPPLD